MMYFYQVLQSCDEFKVVSEFLAMIKCQDKCSVNKNIRTKVKIFTTFIYSIDQIKKPTVSRQFLGLMF